VLTALFVDILMGGVTTDHRSRPQDYALDTLTGMGFSEE
jgi:hypothetical protein